MAALFLLAACSPTSDQTASETVSLNASGNIVATNGIEHDWGDININGGLVSHTFKLKNESEESLYLKGAKTSCMCTSARYSLNDGTISPKYGMHNNPSGWSEEIGPNETFEVEVVFDPMAHGPDAVGAIRRSVFLNTSAKNSSVLKLDVGGNVLYKKDYEAKNNS